MTVSFGAQTVKRDAQVIFFIGKRSVLDGIRRSHGDADAVSAFAENPLIGEVAVSVLRDKCDGEVVGDCGRFPAGRQE